MMQTSDNATIAFEGQGSNYNDLKQSISRKPLKLVKIVDDQVATKLNTISTPKVDKMDFFPDIQEEFNPQLIKINRKN